MALKITNFLSKNLVQKISILKSLLWPLETILGLNLVGYGCDGMYPRWYKAFWVEITNFIILNFSRKIEEI